MIQVKQLRAGMKLPERKTTGAVGYDLYVPGSIVIPAGRSIVPMGFAIAIPEAVIGFIKGRSGYDAKGMEGYEVVAFRELPPPEDLLAQCLENKMPLCRFDVDVISGEVDPDYRGEVGVIVKNNEVHPVLIPGGTRIAQMNFIPCLTPELQLTDTLSETLRGDGGFGHSNETSPTLNFNDKNK